jgi:N-acetylglucosamine kinase-like BadF-type ATPase
MHNNYILGIDGGGTKTLVAIADLNGKIVGTGQGGPANFDDVGISTVQANIATAVAMACQQANLPQEPFASVFLGMAGVVSTHEHAFARQIALNLNLAEPEQIGIGHDCRIALAGGLSGRPGIVLIVGTGSSCYGKTADGREWRSGGWGHLISDEGSSYWLGVQAMRAAVMVSDGRLPASMLLENVQHYFGLVEINDLMHRIYVQGLSRSKIAALAPLVIQAAEAGDSPAQELIRHGAQDLAECVLAVADQLGISNTASSAGCEVALVGGLLKAGDTYINPLRQAIHERLPYSQVRQAELPPVAGACMLALKCLGLLVSADVIEALGRSTLLHS